MEPEDDRTPVIISREESLQHRGGYWGDDMMHVALPIRTGFAKAWAEHPYLKNDYAMLASAVVHALDVFSIREGLGLQALKGTATVQGWIKEAVEEDRRRREA